MRRHRVLAVSAPPSLPILYGEVDAVAADSGLGLGPDPAGARVVWADPCSVVDRMC